MSKVSAVLLCVTAFVAGPAARVCAPAADTCPTKPTAAGLTSSTRNTRARWAPLRRRIRTRAHLRRRPPRPGRRPDRLLRAAQRPDGLPPPLEERGRTAPTAHADIPPRKLDALHAAGAAPRRHALPFPPDAARVHARLHRPVLGQLPQRAGGPEHLLPPRRHVAAALHAAAQRR